MFLLIHQPDLVRVTGRLRFPGWMASWLRATYRRLRALIPAIAGNPHIDPRIRLVVDGPRYLAVYLFAQVLAVQIRQGKALPDGDGDLACPIYLEELELGAEGGLGDGQVSLHLHRDPIHPVGATVIRLPVPLELPVLLRHLAKIPHRRRMPSVLQTAVDGAPAAVATQLAGGAVLQVLPPTPHLCPPERV